MALFGKKKTEEVTKKPKKESLAITEAQVKVGVPGFGITFTLKPRVTEKSSMLAKRGVYTFDVPQGASKGAIAKAVTAIWKVHPVKIAIVKTAGKSKMSKGKKGRKADMKKAYVYLKKGEKIEIGLN
ncbi:MAG: 50S ribosomal protein L23 [Patescibacteria group bacterium]